MECVIVLSVVIEALKVKFQVGRSRMLGKTKETRVVGGSSKNSFPFSNPACALILLDILPKIFVFSHLVVLKTLLHFRKLKKNSGCTISTSKMQQCI